MGRAPRRFGRFETYHVWSRGSNRQVIFLLDSDRLEFLACLERVVARSPTRCLAYCLMSNHYHLVVETLDGGLSRAMQALNGSYARRFNKRHGRDAHVFRNRFGAAQQRSDEQLLWTLRYTVRNPVDSGLCGSAEDWQWSSYRASAGLEPSPRFLDVRRLLSYFGDMPDRAREIYCAYMNDCVGV